MECFDDECTFPECLSTEEKSHITINEQGIKVLLNTYLMSVVTWPLLGSRETGERGSCDS